MRNIKPRKIGRLYKENWALLPTTGSFLFLFYLTSFLNKRMSSLNSNEMINVDFAAANFFAMIVSHFLTPAMNLSLSLEKKQSYSEMVFNKAAISTTALLEFEFLIVTAGSWALGRWDKPMFNSENNAQIGAQNFFFTATAFLTVRAATATTYKILTARNPKKAEIAKNEIKENAHIMLQALGFILVLLTVNSLVVPNISNDKDNSNAQVLIGLIFTALPFTALLRAPIQYAADRTPWLQQVSMASGERKPLNGGDKEAQMTPTATPVDTAAGTEYKSAFGSIN